jgi:hypothetical protein
MSEGFIQHLKDKNQGVDIDKLLQIFDKAISDVQASQGLDEIKLPLSCDLNKAILASVVGEYLKE